MLINTLLEEAGDTDVESSGAAAENVHPILVEDAVAHRESIARTVSREHLVSAWQRKHSRDLSTPPRIPRSRDSLLRSR